MSPATTLSLFVVLVSSMVLMALLLVPTARRHLALTRRGVDAPRFLAVSALALMLLSVPGGPLAATAATPPPAMRVMSETNDAPSESVRPIAVVYRFGVTRGSNIYTVVTGDSLWRIASAQLAQRGGSPRGEEVARFWHEIYQANRDVIGLDPALIMPGQVLTIPGGSRG